MSSLRIVAGLLAVWVSLGIIGTVDISSGVCTERRKDAELAAFGSCTESESYARMLWGALLEQHGAERHVTLEFESYTGGEIESGHERKGAGKHLGG